jgi:hypothetical protein
LSAFAKRRERVRRPTGSTLDVVDMQQKSLAAVPRDPQYRAFLDAHGTDLIRAAEALGKPDDAAAARGELDKLRASDSPHATK